jgi:signal transduction histidine kinase/DNA-binding NarL/FixJ family response regulator/PAS domain-containing protein
VLFPIIKKIWTTIAHVQILFVFLAFTLMVSLSSWFLSNIFRKQLLYNAKTVLDSLETQINLDLQEPKTVLGNLSQTVRGMILEGDNANVIYRYLKNITSYILLGEEKQLAGFSDIYGYFDVFGGMFIDGMNRTFKETLNLHECLWYKEAESAGGEIILSQPCADMESGDVIITYARSIFDAEARLLGVIALDLQIDRIKEYIINSNLGKTGYGFLLDNQYEILIHSDPALQGTKFTDVSVSAAKLVIMLNLENDVSEFKMINYKGDSSITFVRKLENGWYIGVVTPESEYFRELKTIRLILIILGIVLAFLLSAVLLSIIAARKKTEERIQIMFDAMPLSAGIHDKNFIYFECNKSAINMFELSSKQDYLTNFRRLSPEYQPDGRLSIDKMNEFVDKAFTEGYARFEWMHQKLNKEPIPCEVTLVRVEHDNEFVLAAYQRDLRDLKTAITQKNESEQSLRLLRNIMNSIDAQVYVTVPHSGEILFVNDCMKKDFNVGDDCIGKFCYKVFLKDVDGICDFCPCYKLDKTPNNTVVWEMHNPVTNRIYRNTTRYIEWSDGRNVQIQHSVDMTELIAAKEQAEQSSRFKSQFLSRMSHEVRTPMNAILGITEIQLQDEIIPPGRREALEKIFNSGYLLLGIINDILDLSKIEAGKLELSPAGFDVINLINDTVPLIVMQFEHKPIRFKLQADENIPLTLFGDELRIKQILNNLLSNAFKYTDNGEVSLSVNAEYAMQGEERQVTLVLRVADTGHGMTFEQMDKLFDEYTRFNMEANRTTEGAGLGMSITKQLVRMMNGDIQVESEPGKGSVFTVRLPQGVIGSGVLGRELADNVKKFNVGRAAQINNAPQFVREYMPYGRVLLVDDVETNLYVARGLMAPYGLSIEIAASGFEAVEKIENGSTYDIIFMDHFMPKMDGMETTKKIREMGYTNPIIALTANALAGQAEMFMENGFDGFISKPIDIRQLNALLNKFIRDKYPSEVINIARRQAAKINTAKFSENMRQSSGPELAAIFTRDAEKANEALKTILSGGFREKDDFMQYVISAHSMKSALANIGEPDLSDLALKLELAGRSENISVIKAKTPEFLEKLSEVIKRNKPKEDENGAEKKDPEKSRVNLAEKLRVIRIACENNDAAAANKALYELRQRKWPNFTKELLDTIEEDLLSNNLKEASKLIEDYETIMINVSSR